MVSLVHSRIVELGNEVRRGDGATIFSEGERTSTVYALVDGTVRIEISTKSGKRLVIAQRAAGDIVGELSAIDGSPRSATAVADGDVRLASISGAAFVELLAIEPLVAAEVMRLMSYHLRVAAQRTAHRNSADITQRLSRRLLDLARDQASDLDGDAIDLRLTQEDLAGWIGASREATARAFASLRADKIVATARRQVTVLDLAKLEAAAR